MAEAEAIVKKFVSSASSNSVVAGSAIFSGFLAAAMAFLGNKKR